MGIKKLKKRQTTRHRNTKRNSDLEYIGFALDFLMGNLYFPGIPFRSPQDFNTFENLNELAIKKFYQIKPRVIVSVPKSLSETYQDYVMHRLALNDYHNKGHDDGFRFGIDIAKDLGNIDPMNGKIVLQNDSETNIFWDYLNLYCYKKGKRYAIDWLEKNQKVLNNTNKKVVTAYCVSHFSVLRLDKNLSYGAIQTVDIISKKSHILVDKALNESKKEGCFFICSIIDMGNYIMTTGGGIIVDSYSQGGKAILTIVAKHLDSFKGSKLPLTDEIAKGVREIYSFCLRNGTLTHMTANDVY